MNDQFNGRGTGSLYGTPLEPCPAGVSAAIVPSCYVNGVPVGAGLNVYNSYFGGAVNSYLLGPTAQFSTSTVIDRDNVFNLHFGIPH